MASQSTGIQQLLVAEKRAAEKVGEARKRMYLLHIVDYGRLCGMVVSVQFFQLYTLPEI